MPIHALGTILAGAELSKLRTVDSLELDSRIVVKIAYRPKASTIKEVIAKGLLSLRGRGINAWNTTIGIPHGERLAYCGAEPMKDAGPGPLRYGMAVTTSGSAPEK